MSTSYKKDSTFNPLWLGRVKTLDDVITALAKIEEHHSDVAAKANKEFERVQSAKSAGGATVIVAGGSSASSGGSGGAGSLLSLGLRAGKQAVVAAGTDISFSLPMATSDFVLFISCYVTTNPMRVVEFNYSNVTVSGFRVTPLENCTCEFIVMPKT